MGTIGRQRLMSQVDVFRNVRIFEEPGPDRTYKFYIDGKIEDYYGVQVDKSTCPVSIGARWMDVIPASVNTSMLAEPSLVFVESAQYNAEQDLYTPSPRGLPDPFDFMNVKDG